jgi:hypothetical protein
MKGMNKTAPTEVIGRILDAGQDQNGNSHLNSGIPLLGCLSDRASYVAFRCAEIQRIAGTIAASDP